MIASCPQFYRIFEFLSLGNQAFAIFTSNYKKLRSMYRLRRDGILYFYQTITINIIAVIIIH